MRRRPRSCDKREKTKNLKRELPKSVERIPERSENRRSSTSSKEGDTNSDSSKRNSLKNQGVLLFGNDLDKQPVPSPIEFSSDQESTGGEEENETVGMFLNILIDSAQECSILKDIFMITSIIHNF